MEFDIQGVAVTIYDHSARTWSEEHHISTLSLLGLSVGVTQPVIGNGCGRWTVTVGPFTFHPDVPPISANSSATIGGCTIHCPFGIAKRFSPTAASCVSHRLVSAMCIEDNMAGWKASPGRLSSLTSPAAVIATRADMDFPSSSGGWIRTSP